MSTEIKKACEFIDGFDGFNQRILSERSKRIENGKKVISFGVSFLDDALGGIYSNDLIVLGAKAGAGKTQACTLMALNAAKAGKRVHYLALEAEEFEIERRIKYQTIANLFYTDPRRPKVWLNYLDWYYGKLDYELDKYERASEELCDFSNLNIFYRKKDFTEEEFERIYLSVKDESDLVIIDHLHYFDFTDENENRAVKSIVKRIRDLTLNIGKPVILVSHIRKTDKRLKQLVPDLEDFHGSSDIGKIATKAIVLAPDLNSPKTNESRATFFSILKCRADGARTRAMSLCKFNLNQQNYEEGYALGNLSSDQSEFNLTEPKDIPRWAKHCMNEINKNYLK